MDEVEAYLTELRGPAVSKPNRRAGRIDTTPAHQCPS